MSFAAVGSISTSWLRTIRSLASPEPVAIPQVPAGRMVGESCLVMWQRRWDRTLPSSPRVMPRLVSGAHPSCCTAAPCSRCTADTSTEFSLDIGDLHGNMALYGWERCGFVPAFQAVYQGWTVNAGLLEWPIPTNKSDPTLKTGWVQGTNLASWMAYSALQLVYGHIPGAMMTQDLLFVLENSAEALALWRDMMRVRADARDFLVFGQMLRPPAATVPLQSIRLCGNKPVKAYPCCPVPEVVASVFKAKNGSVALIAANIANVTVAYEAIVDLGGGKHVNVSVSMLPTSARVVLLPALRHLQQRK